MPAGATASSRRSQAEAAILQGAAELVAEKGIDRFTLEEAAERAGYSRGLPRHYFGSKMDLTLAVARYTFETFVSRLRSSHPPENELDALIETVGLYFDSLARDRVIVRVHNIIVAGALTNPRLARSIEAFARGSLRNLERRLRRGIDRGDVRAGIDPKAQASMILGLLRGVVVLWLNDPRSISLKSVRSELIASLRVCLSPR